jgi:AraC-like DNA-binding protein
MNTALLEILDDLGRQKKSRFLCTAHYNSKQHQGQEDRINRVYRHLNENISEPILQSEVAKKLRLSPPAFARFFRRITGKKFTQIVNEMRVELACRQLRETDKNISEICYECGFANLSNFNRQFLRLRQITPRHYRACLVEGIRISGSK